MITVFRLPDLGEGLTESEVVAWHVSPGDVVALNQHIADVETAKAVVELPSPFAGTVTELHQQPGVVIQVGDPLVSFEVADASGTETAGTDTPGTDAGAPSARAEAPAERTAVLVGYGAATERAGHPVRRRRRPAPEVLSAPSVEAVESGFPVPAPAAAAAERPRSTPPVRALARELGIDLRDVNGTGPGGLITRDDVSALARPDRRAVGLTPGIPPATARSVAGGATPVATPNPDPGERETRSPIRSLRKLTAAAMVQSAFTAPHVTEFLTVDVTPTLELIEAVNRRAEQGQAHLGILAVVAKALCIAVARQPSVNTRWEDAAGEIVQFHYVNLGIAVATSRGLVVPVIADANRLTVTDLAGKLATLAAAARGGTTPPADLRGGTITITNIGVFGVDAGTPILNPGEAAILAMGAIRRQPWEYRGEIALRQIMTLALSFDHRLVDGEQGARFLSDIGSILANPGIVLTLV